MHRDRAALVTKVPCIETEREMGYKGDMHRDRAGHRLQRCHARKNGQQELNLSNKDSRTITILFI